MGVAEVELELLVEPERRVMEAMQDPDGRDVVRQILDWRVLDNPGGNGCAKGNEKVGKLGRELPKT